MPITWKTLNLYGNSVFHRVNSVVLSRRFRAAFKILPLRRFRVLFYLMPFLLTMNQCVVVFCCVLSAGIVTMSVFLVTCVGFRHAVPCSQVWTDIFTPSVSRLLGWPPIWIYIRWSPMQWGIHHAAFTDLHCLSSTPSVATTTPRTLDGESPSEDGGTHLRSLAIFTISRVQINRR